MRSFIHAAALMGAVFFIFGNGNIAFAQSAPERCEQCVCGYDSTCYDESCFFGELFCKIVNFTATCGGDHTLAAELVCSNSEQCAACVSCVWLKKADGTPVRNIHTTCTANDCWEEMQVTLAQGGSYRMYVCLQACNQDGCASCTRCTAKGWVYYPDSSPCNSIICQ